MIRTAEYEAEFESRKTRYVLLRWHMTVHSLFWKGFPSHMQMQMNLQGVGDARGKVRGHTAYVLGYVEMGTVGLTCVRH